MVSSCSVDIMAVGAHPDDVEIGMGGTIAKYSRLGKKIQIVHLTKAELSSNGTVESRQSEAEQACKTLGINMPVQLSYPDRGLKGCHEESVKELVMLIRKYRPKLLFAPYYKDRHPDHSHCSDICKEAYFSAGIKKYQAEDTGEAFRPEALYFYQINGIGDPDFLVDISDDLKTKYDALACFKSQFFQSEGTVTTPLNNGFLQNLKGRDGILGAEAGVKAAEGFSADKPLVVNHLLGDA